MENYKTKNGKIKYRVKVRTTERKAISKVFNTKTQAKAWKSLQVTKKYQGILEVKSVEVIAFSEMASVWFQNKVAHVLATKTVQTYQCCLQKHLIPFFRNKNISEINLQHIDELKSRMSKLGLKPKTINRTMTILRQILMYGQDSGHIENLPFKRSLLVKLAESKFNCFSETEVKQLLLANRSQDIYPIIFLAVHTGMRIGEILGLCWDRINFDSKQIEITRTLHRGGVLQNSTKSKRIRYFPINETLKRFFLELARKQICPQFVFAKSEGVAFDPDHFSGRNFRAACERANVPCLRFHDLRHTYASTFMMNGGGIYSLQRLLGHSDVKTTTRYAHLSKEHLEEESNLVNFEESGSSLAHESGECEKVKSVVSGIHQ